MKLISSDIKPNIKIFIKIYLPHKFVAHYKTFYFALSNIKFKLFSSIYKIVRLFILDSQGNG